MWEISETSVFISTLTWLIAQEDFNTFNHHERLKSYILIYCTKIFWDQLHQSWVKMQCLRHLPCPFRIIYINPDDGRRASYQNISFFTLLDMRDHGAFVHRKLQFSCPHILLSLISLLVYESFCIFNISHIQLKFEVCNNGKSPKLQQKGQQLHCSIGWNVG